MTEQTRETPGTEKVREELRLYAIAKRETTDYQASAMCQRAMFCLDDLKRRLGEAEEANRLAEQIAKFAETELTQLRARVAELEAIAKRAVQMDRDLVPMIDPNEGNGKIIRLALANHGRDARVALKEPPK
jgi:hypothetical protein